MEWDETKSNENRALRGLGFEIAYEFDWESAFVRLDTRRDYGEHRWQAYGWARNLPIAIVYTLRRGHKRIISVRQMHKKEVRKYGI